MGGREEPVVFDFRGKQHKARSDRRYGTPVAAGGDPPDSGEEKRERRRYLDGVIRTLRDREKSPGLRQLPFSPALPRRLEARRRQMQSFCRGKTAAVSWSSSARPAGREGYVWDAAYTLDDHVIAPPPCRDPTCSNSETWNRDRRCGPYTRQGRRVRRRRDGSA